MVLPMLLQFSQYVLRQAHSYTRPRPILLLSHKTIDLHKFRHESGYKFLNATFPFSETIALPGMPNDRRKEIVWGNGKSPLVRKSANGTKLNQNKQIEMPITHRPSLPFYCWINAPLYKDRKKYAIYFFLIYLTAESPHMNTWFLDSWTIWWWEHTKNPTFP